MKEDCSVYDAKAGEEIKNRFHEKWVKLDHKHKAYKVADKALDKIDRDEYKMCLLSVVSIDDDSHFLAFYSGGLNGAEKDDKWCWYFDGIKKVFSAFDYAWLVDMDNDCCDDVWYMTLGFTI